jgi:hypothetical protein
MSRASEVAMDKKWQAQSDARTLADAMTIKSTPARLKAAVKEAKVMAKEMKKESDSITKISGITIKRG